MSTGKVKQSAVRELNISSGELAPRAHSARANDHGACGFQMFHEPLFQRVDVNFSGGGNAEFLHQRKVTANRFDSD